MKITIEDQGRKVELTTESVEIELVLSDVKDALLGFGFHIDSINEGFLAVAEDIEFNKKENENENS